MTTLTLAQQLCLAQCRLRRAQTIADALQERLREHEAYRAEEEARLEQERQDVRRLYAM